MNPLSAAVERSAGHEFVMSRVFDAPRQVLWRAWTEPPVMAHWWRPQGYTPAISTVNLRPGGHHHFSLHDRNGREIWGRLSYLEVIEPERLVFLASFSDRFGGLTRHPESADWPLEMLTIITFEEQASQTRLTVRWAPHHAAERGLEAFEAGRGLMQRGWTGTLQDLANYLSNAPPS